MYTLPQVSSDSPPLPASSDGGSNIRLSARQLMANVSEWFIWSKLLHKNEAFLRRDHNQKLVQTVGPGPGVGNPDPIEMF